MSDRIFVANYGEIVVRIIKTCKESGTDTVTDYTESESFLLSLYE